MTSVDISEVASQEPQTTATRHSLEWTAINYSVDTSRGHWYNRPYTIIRDHISGTPPPPEDHTKTILNDISGWCDKGQIVGILGPSGSGKTTLLKAIAGRLATGNLQGNIWVESKKRDPVGWRFASAFLEQADTLQEHLTVRETVMFSAMLRLSRHLPAILKRQRADHVISMLRLDACKNTEISLASGGERKRTAMAIEILTSPSYIFLDEPTSGLDSFTALSVVETAATLAQRQQSAVILSIHQPGPAIMKLLDRIILLSRGHIVFSGPPHEAVPHFSSLGIFSPPNVNPFDFLLEAITLDTRNDQAVINSQLRFKLLVDAWRDQGTTAEKPSSDILASRESCSKLSGWWRQNLDILESNYRLWRDRIAVPKQFHILLRRNFLDYRRFRTAVIALTAQTILLASFISAVFWQQSNEQISIQNRLGVIFFLVAQEMFAFTMPVSVALPGEKLMIARERANVTYKTSSAYLAKIVSILPQSIISTAVLGTVVYWAVGLQPY
eukprot:Partr_v1_DN27961_c1_g1_i2_m11685 putative ATP-binding cassette, sub-family G (WHITE), member